MYQKRDEDQNILGLHWNFDFSTGKNHCSQNFISRPLIFKKCHKNGCMVLFSFSLPMSENKFVSQFTIAEAVAVGRLQEELPDILHQAFGDTLVYTLWGIPLDKDSEDDRLKVILVKFVRAR